MPGAFLEQSGPAQMELVEGRIVCVLTVNASASGKALTVEVRPRAWRAMGTRARALLRAMRPAGRSAA